MPKNLFTVFTKPWKMPLPELGEFIAGLGFDGIELPVRPDYQVEPDAVTTGLPEAARILGDYGVRIVSIAGPTDETAIAACAEAGVPIIRICQPMNDPDGYLAAERRVCEEYDALVPRLDRHGVTLGVQNHCDLQVPHALGLRRILERYDPRHIAAVWDPAHCALDGERPELAADIVWPHLCMLNLKNAVWVRTSEPDAEFATWRHTWVPGREGLCPWPVVAAETKARGYAGPICLTAEYSDHDRVDEFIVQDLAFARSLFCEEEE